MELRNHLQLPEEDRKAYTESKIRSGILQLRLIFFLCGLLYALFGILDYLVVDKHLTTFLVIRFVIVIPMTLLYLAWTFHPSFIQMGKALTFILVVTGGVGPHASASGNRVPHRQNYRRCVSFGGRNSIPSRTLGWIRVSTKTAW